MNRQAIAEKLHDAALAAAQLATAPEDERLRRTASLPDGNVARDDAKGTT